MRRELLRVGMSQVRHGLAKFSMKSSAQVVMLRLGYRKAGRSCSAGPARPPPALPLQMSAGSKTDVGAYHRDDSPATEENLADLQAGWSWGWGGWAALGEWADNQVR